MEKVKKEPYNPIAFKFKQEALTDTLDNYFRGLHDRGAFNGSVLIARGDHIIYESFLGWADRSASIPIDSSTSFQLASVSKQFTAVAILMLKEMGLLKLDDRVEKYYPSFPYKGITIRMLLQHRSGLPNYIYFCDPYFLGRTEPISNQFVIHLMSKLKPPAYYPPDYKYNYSNTGYMILAAIVEKVTGMPFASFMREEVFKPLGMSRSYVITDTQRPQGSLAKGYRFGFKEAGVTYLDGVVGDKGVYASARDLLRWDRALYTGYLLKPEVLAEAFIPHPSDRDKNKKYGFGWRIEYLGEGTKVLYHSGWWEGFQAYLARIPGDTTTIIVLKNVKNGGIERKAILSKLYPRAFTAEGEEKSLPGQDNEENDVNN